jgi:hypothetical protein
VSLQEYRQFIASRAVAQTMQGFAPKTINDMAKQHQRAALDFALNRGKSASKANSSSRHSAASLMMKSRSEETRS